MRAWLLLLAGCASAQPELLQRAGEGMRGRVERSHPSDVTLACDPPDGDVWLDGVQQGTCADFTGEPRGLKLGDGMHKVEVRKPGFAPYETYLDSSGTRAALNVKLLPVN